MTLGVMQPYLLPYIGYFQLINAVDKYVVYDDVAYINGGWINRNRILINGCAQMFTVRLSAASQNRTINSIDIADDFVKLRKTFQLNYMKAPYFKDVMPLLDEILSYEDMRLGMFIFNSLRLLADYMGIKTEFVLSSDLKKDNALKGQDKILAICKELQANTYINAAGGQELYDKESFLQNKIELKFLKTGEIAYPQFANEFIPDLSIVDVLMFNSTDEISKMLDNYKLI